MTHSYKSEYPSSPTIDAGIQKFFEEFYEISDTPDVHAKYLEQFSEDATFILGSKISKGHHGELSYFSKADS